MDTLIAKVLDLLHAIERIQVPESGSPDDMSPENRSEVAKAHQTAAHYMAVSLGLSEALTSVCLLKAVDLVCAKKALQGAPAAREVAETAVALAVAYSDRNAGSA